MLKYKLLLHSARQIVLVTSKQEKVLIKDGMKNIAVLEKPDEVAEGYGILVDSNGLIASVGKDSEVKAVLGQAEVETVIDATGQCVIPGLVDGHTHAVWTGDRVHEFAMKLAGASYMQVHAAGGGIHFTVDRVRAATQQHLYHQFKGFAQRMLEAGTTLAEVKSGYGLDADTEIKMLKVIEQGKNDPELYLDISSTYCGAHAIPKNKSSEEATRDVLEVQLPQIHALMSAGELHVDNIDVFCEKGVFDVDQTRRILEAGMQMGLAVNFHGEELCRLNSAEMGAKIGAHAISHLEEVSQGGIAAMARSGTVGVVLPTTAYILRLTPPPVRDMIIMGVPVALGSDFNPNAHCLAMPVVMHLACVLLHMSMPEALAAATINAAASLRRSHIQGSLEVGKLGDMIVLDAPRWEHLIYQLGSHHHVIRYVIKNGRVVHSRRNNDIETLCTDMKNKKND